MKNKIALLSFLMLLIAATNCFASADPCNGKLNRISDNQIICLTDDEIANVQTIQAATRVAVAAQKLIADAKTALDETDQIAIRTAKAGGNYAAATAWVTRDTALRAIVNGGPGPIPDYPRNQDGSIAYP